MPSRRFASASTDRNPRVLRRRTVPTGDSEVRRRPGNLQRKKTREDYVKQTRRGSQNVHESRKEGKGSACEGGCKRKCKCACKCRSRRLLGTDAATRCKLARRRPSAPARVHSASRSFLARQLPEEAGSIVVLSSLARTETALSRSAPRDNCVHGQNRHRTANPRSVRAEVGQAK